MFLAYLNLQKRPFSIYCFLSILYPKFLPLNAEMLTFIKHVPVLGNVLNISFVQQICY